MSDIHDRYNEVEKLIDDEKFEEAIEGLTSIIGEDDSFVLAHLALARVYTKTGQHEIGDQTRRKGLRARAGRFVQFHRDECDISAGLGRHSGSAVHR